MELPEDFEKEIMPFVDDFEPTPKDLLIARLLEAQKKYPLCTELFIWNTGTYVF